MKTFSCFLILILFATCSFAQNIVNPPTKLHQVRNANLKFSQPQRLRGAGQQINLYYDYLDEQNYDAGDYLSYIWASNAHYSLSAQDPVDSTGMNYCYVDFDTLVDANTFYTYPENQVESLTIDTIAALIGHTNHSGMLDTIRVTVFSLKDGSLVWTTDITTDTGLSISPTGFHNWYSTYVLTVPCGVTINNPGENGYGVGLQYFGDKRDTFGFIAGFGNPGQEICAASQQPKASKSAYYPNSYAYWVGQQALLPTQLGGDIYYDCNSNGVDDPSDGANFIQNINIETIVTIITGNVATGIKPVAKSNVTVNTYPNPFNETSAFEVKGLSGNYSFVLTNVLGEKVQELTTISSTHFEINRVNLVAGIYFYSIISNGKAVANGKVIIQ